ncbi:allophanate hydrolase [Erwinia sp. OLTSP20]|nr:allophanate hydrolase [Erwinia sp. OAMSP11]PIJ75437.1 allophanate hydrolase [Erwinia sp. OLSSP12]PIJ81987.1 allophanate hydrolase [Erwinia sp. OLCASP19]PIJ84642.1 allophanate hydrolase [Erwinia sp. OLMTSP26]PIJ86991.1 allophanate hydrolase [Erwinia sp. OLMDSP33]PIJ91084.1 allophanate hydrolase [Erwinia sp. OLFS4]PIJ92573.1 allophanate hydrolase [Erwinia sp. OLTSP20]
MRFLPVNHDALLIELASLEETLALLDKLQHASLPAVDEMVPAARTLLLRFQPQKMSAQCLADLIGGWQLNGRQHATGKLIEIPVCYDGEDLPQVAGMLGITVAEVIRRHSETEFSVAFTGFAPGFAYLCGDSGLTVARRPAPRPRIPAGSVGLAGEFTGIYPKASPGGWQLIATTRMAMWDLSRATPALLQPGMRVRFHQKSTRHTVLPAVGAEKPQKPAPGDATLEIVAPGIQMLFQDEGRAGKAGQGVSTSGALDRGALHSANRLVGNPASAVCLELLPAGVVIEVLADCVIALTGASCAISLTTASNTQHQLSGWQPLALLAGDRLQLGAAQQGARCYLSLRGGFAVIPVLDSGSTDTLAQLGPAALCQGTILRRQRAAAVCAVAINEMAPDRLPCAGETITLDVVMGPRTDWFTPQAVALFARQRWRVTPLSNRTGLRLEGDSALSRSQPGELPSEGIRPGAIQVPANGQPVLFLADHPLTGGYPVIASVADWHLDLAGQLSAGVWLRFNPVLPFNPLRPARSAGDERME